MVDLVVLGILGMRGWHGWKRGTLLMLISLAGLFAGYVGALLLFRPVGNYLNRTFDVPVMVALPVAAMLIMGLITGGLRMARFAVERRRGEARLQGVTHSPLDSAGGALISAVWGLGLVMLVAWALMGLHGALKIGPDISRSVTGRVTSSVMQKVTYTLTRRRTGSSLMANMLALAVGQPGTGVEMMNTLLSNQRVRGLWTDSTLRNALARGDVEALTRHPSLRALARDTQFVHAAATVGLAGASAGATGDPQLAANLVAQVGPIVRSFQSMGSDPEMRRLMNDPELQRALNRGDVGAIIGNPRFRQIAERFMDALRGAGQTARN